MKQVLLLLAAGSIALSANAQSLPAGARLDNAGSDNSSYAQLPARMQTGMPSHKTTAGPTTRWYNYGNYFDTAVATIGGGTGRLFSYMMWNDTMTQVNYTSGVAHNTNVSCAQVLEPFYSGFNDAVLYPTSMNMSSTNAYVVDSLQIWGVYDFNVAKPLVKDTITVTITYGNGTTGSDIGYGYWAGSASASLLGHYGLSATDTLFTPTVQYDSVLNRGRGANLKTVRIVVDSSMWGDTLSNGLWAHAIAIPGGGLNVPAGNLVAVTETFRSGDASFTAHDSVYHSGNAYYNNFRPLLIAKVNSSGSPMFVTPYNRFDLNTGHFKQKLSGLTYIPYYGWTSGGGASSLQHVYMDVHVSCPTCSTVSVRPTVA